MKRSGADHPKIKHLASLLNINEAWAVGIVELLWHFTAKYAPQGDIGKYDDKAIARAVKWDKRPGLTLVPPEFLPSSGLVTSELWLSSSLVRAKFLDRCSCHRFVVHDWPDHADQQVKRKLASQKLDFAHPINSLPEPGPVPEPVPAAGASKTAAAAAARPPAEPAKTNGAAAELPSFDRTIEQALHDLAQEGQPLPDKTVVNEYGRAGLNPVYERMIAAIRHAEPRIRSARMPVAFAKKVILDALKGA